jgi:hypothetical protein
MGIEAGAAFAIKINAHRSMWDGKICSKPTEWNCGAPINFRESTCAAGRDYCFHINVFAGPRPRALVLESTVQALLADNPKIFDDQILFFYGTRFDQTRGIQTSGPETVVHGAYRVKSARLEISGTLRQVVIEPYEDGWAMFPQNRVRKFRTPPAFEGVTYLGYSPHADIYRYFDTALEEARTVSGSTGFGDEHMARVLAFRESLDDWIAIASESLASTLPETDISKAGASVLSFSSGRQPAGVLQEGLAKMLASGTLRPTPYKETAYEPPVIGDAEPFGRAALAIAGSSANEPAIIPIKLVVESAPPADWTRPPLPENPQCALVEAQYGASTLTALRIGTADKPILLLAGATGVGKSWLAPRLLDDPSRERTIMVPVPSTWRGHEDLLGYVNPISHQFEPTQFSRFLLRASNAWRAGDRRLRVAVFEEFNLSPPEHWLSDFLALLEYEQDRIHDRTIHLGGSHIAGESTDVPTSFYIPPTVILVATVNQDHTVRHLSPRVLDRAALIEIETTVHGAMVRAGVTDLLADVEQALEDLNEILQPLGVGFSIRSARSLQAAIAHMGKDEIMNVLDHVLVQEVLSKVRLNAGDLQDEDLLGALAQWVEQDICSEFTLCKKRFDRWKNQLQRGRDVFQI